jgi:Selenocysteine lyase
MCSNVFRNFVVGVDTRVPLGNGKLIPSINFDNAATTPPFVSVMKAIMDFAPWYSSVHRGAGYKSKVSTDVFEKSRFAVLNFVNACEDDYTVIFVKNTSEAINKLSWRLCEDNKRHVILSTDMEHHSNDLPWRKNYRVDYINIDDSGRLSLDDLEDKLKRYRGSVKLVTVAGASNVTGYRNDINKVAAIAHKYGAMVLVDGAQLVPHASIDMNPENPDERIDFLVFSAHKMYAPFGIGVLIGLKEVFKNGEPDCPGGGTVKFVTHDFIRWEDPPHNEEAGTPNLMGVVALEAAIGTLSVLGMNNIESFERSLTDYAIKKLSNVQGIKLYGDKCDKGGRVSIIPFNIYGMNHYLVAEILSREAGIAVRSGCFCAQPYIQKLLKVSRKEIEVYKEYPDAVRPGMVRLSFGLYNDFYEIDALINTLCSIADNKEYYIKKYGRFIRGQT